MSHLNVSKSGDQSIRSVSKNIPEERNREENAKIGKSTLPTPKKETGEKKLGWVAQGGLEVSARPAFVTDYSRDTTCFMELHTCRF